LVDVVDEWMKSISEKTESKLDDMLRPMVRTSLRATIIILALVQVATILSDKPMTSVIAGLGVGGLAIGLASQDMVKNFFGSVMILSDHPFEINDFIEASGHTGTVESVGFRSTRLRTPDGHVVTIPNGGLANESIKNLSARPFLKRSFGLGLTYDTSPEQIENAIAIVNQILDQHNGMSEDKPPLVNFTELTDSTLNLQVTYWHFPADWASFRALNDHVNLEILRRFNAAGLEFAFPSQSIYLAGDGPDAA
jgi:MscS family membrane protein